MLLLIDKKLFMISRSAAIPLLLAAFTTKQMPACNTRIHKPDQQDACKNTEPNKLGFIWLINFHSSFFK